MVGQVKQHLTVFQQQASLVWVVGILQRAKNCPNFGFNLAEFRGNHSLQDTATWLKNH